MSEVKERTASSYVLELEQLCRDMYDSLEKVTESGYSAARFYTKRMEYLGLKGNDKQ